MKQTSTVTSVMTSAVSLQADVRPVPGMPVRPANTLYTRNGERVDVGMLVWKVRNHRTR